MSNLYDAFGRLRTSRPFTLFDATHVGRLNTDAFDYSGSFLYDVSSSTVRLDSSNGDTAIAQSKQIIPYQPGKSLLCMLTFAMSDSNTSIERVGYFSADHGVFLEKNYGTYKFVIRDGSANDTSVSQTSWSERQLNSGSTVLDLTKAQIYWNDIEWLGVGNVRNGFIIDGKFIECHKFEHANSTSSTYMQSAMLPIRYEITEYGTETKSLTQICSTVESEGGYELRSIPRSIKNGATTAVTTEQSILAVRLGPDYVMDKVVIMSYANIIAMSSASRSVSYRVVHNPNVPSGTTWRDVSNSVMQFTEATDISRGTDVRSGFIEARSNVELDSSDLNLQVGRNIDGTSEVVAILVEKVTGSPNVATALGWYEI